MQFQKIYTSSSYQLLPDYSISTKGTTLQHNNINKPISQDRFSKDCHAPYIIKISPQLPADSVEQKSLYSLSQSNSPLAFNPNSSNKMKLRKVSQANQTSSLNMSKSMSSSSFNQKIGIDFSKRESNCLPKDHLQNSPLNSPIISHNIRPVNISKDMPFDNFSNKHQKVESLNKYNCSVMHTSEIYRKESQNVDIPNPNKNIFSSQIQRHSRYNDPISKQEAIQCNNSSINPIKRQKELQYNFQNDLEQLSFEIRGMSNSVHTSQKQLDSNKSTKNKNTFQQIQLQYQQKKNDKYLQVIKQYQKQIKQLKQINKNMDLQNKKSTFNQQQAKNTIWHLNQQKQSKQIQFQQKIRLLNVKLQQKQGQLESLKMQKLMKIEEIERLTMQIQQKQTNIAHIFLISKQKEDQNSKLLSQLQDYKVNVQALTMDLNKANICKDAIAEQLSLKNQMLIQKQEQINVLKAIQMEKDNKIINLLQNISKSNQEINTLKESFNISCQAKNQKYNQEQQQTTNKIIGSQNKQKQQLHEQIQKQQQQFFKQFNLFIQNKLKSSDTKDINDHQINMTDTQVIINSINYNQRTQINIENFIQQQNSLFDQVDQNHNQLEQNVSKICCIQNQTTQKQKLDSLIVQLEKYIKQCLYSNTSALYPKLLKLVGIQQNINFHQNILHEIKALCQNIHQLAYRFNEEVAKNEWLSSEIMMVQNQRSFEQIKSISLIQEISALTELNVELNDIVMHLTVKLSDINLQMHQAMLLKYSEDHLDENNERQAKKCLNSLNSNRSDELYKSAQNLSAT